MNETFKTIITTMRCKLWEFEFYIKLRVFGLTLLQPLEKFSFEIAYDFIGTRKIEGEKYC